MIFGLFDSALAIRPVLIVISRQVALVQPIAWLAEERIFVYLWLMLETCVGRLLDPRAHVRRVSIRLRFHGLKLPRVTSGSQLCFLGRFLGRRLRCFIVFGFNFLSRGIFVLAFLLLNLWDGFFLSTCDQATLGRDVCSGHF